MASTPRDDRFPFLPSAERVLARTRRDPSSVPAVAGYESATSDEILPVSGDDTSIFARALGRASSDGTTGSTPVGDGEPQILLLDQYGRPWVNVAPGSVQNIQGNIANDAPDAGSFPVKIGGRAVLTPSVGLAAAVAVGDRVDAAYDVNGRQIVAAGGDVAADDPDAGRPVKVGGVAGDPTTGLAAVAAGDRANLAVDPSGRAVVLAQGTVAHDAPDAGFPLKIGSKAATEAPALVAPADRANAWGDLSGRVQISEELPRAGENIVLNYSTIMRQKSPFSQDAWIGRDLGVGTNAVMKPLPGRLGRFQCFNEGPAGLYVLLHDNTVATALSAAVLSPIKWRGWVNAIAGGVPGVLDIGFEELDGIFFTLGICFTTSTSPTAIAGAANVTAGCYII